MGSKASKTMMELKNIRTYSHSTVSFWIGLFVRVPFITHS